MPVNILIGLFALLVALVCYSHGAIGAFRRKTFRPRYLILLWVGFAFDVIATWMMAIQIGGLDLRPGSPMLHTVLALVGMVGMLLIAVLGTISHSKHGELGAAVSRWALAPWAVWVFVFVWGMVSRGAARVVG